MLDLFALWLPILAASVFVFIASSILHMVLPIHRSDFKVVSKEKEVALLDTMRGCDLAPGEYMFPGCQSMQEMQTDEMKAKFDRGPVGLLTVRPLGMPNIGMSLGQWFVLCVVISTFIAYAASLALPRGLDPMKVFRFVATVAFLGYGFSSVVNSIWKSVSWKTTAKFVFDGCVYALVTAATFAWLWPAPVGG